MPVRSRVYFVFALAIAGVSAGRAQSAQDPAAKLAEGPAALARSRSAHEAGNPKDAVKWGEKAVELMPDSASAHLWLGRAYVLEIESAAFYRQLGISKRARESFDRAVSLDPKRYDIRESRARYYFNAPGIAGGSKDKARAEAAAARTADPYRGALLVADIEERDKQVAVAESEFAALARAYPDSTQPFNRLVNLYQTGRQWNDAFRLIDARAARLPRDVSAQYQLGKIAAVSGERLDAGEAAMRAFIAAGNFATAPEANARHRLAMILEKRKDMAGALAEYEHAARLDPKLEDAKAGIKRVKARSP